MTTIYNPTPNRISVQFKEGTFTIEGNGYLRNIPEKIAVEWKSRLHNFLELSDDNAGIAPVVAEIKAEGEESVEGDPEALSGDEPETTETTETTSTTEEQTEEGDVAPVE